MSWQPRVTGRTALADYKKSELGYTGSSILRSTTEPLKDTSS